MFNDYHRAALASVTPVAPARRARSVQRGDDAIGERLGRPLAAEIGRQVATRGGAVLPRVSR
jgi:hypothetical protein